MKTLWPRTEPLLAEAIEPSRFVGTGCGSGSPAAHPPPLTVRRPARPGASAHRDARLLAATAGAVLALALLAGWRRASAAQGWIRAIALRAHHVPKSHQIDPGAGGASNQSTPRPPLCIRRGASAAGRQRAVPARDTRKGFH